jgi:VIT1/CCC1 family predicted Fe2+/Mn2+ transporter
MMLAELGLVTDDVEAWRLGLVTLIAFFLSGIFPLVPYVISWGIERSDRHNGLVCLMIGSIELLSLGYFKGQIINQPFDKRLQSGLEMLVFGLVVVFISFITGGFFKQ